MLLASPIYRAIAAGCLLGCLNASRSVAQVAIETEPATPVRGTLVRLRVTPTLNDLLTGIEGEVAGEPLHFHSADGLTWSSLAGIPIEGGDSVAVTLVLSHREQRDTVHTAIAVSQGNYASEELRVAKAMASPGRAARKRIAADNARAKQVTDEARSSPRYWESPFRLPRPSRITSRYGTARIFNKRVESRHMGTDFNGVVGDTIWAPSRGRVALRADFFLAGKVLYLDHGEGLVSAYFHLSRALVAVGDTVKRGQPIGLVGRSGRVTGPHLHWVTRYGGVSVDPMSVVGLLSSEK
jgi:murein DD-endopeptidase MepM/ murein hydrolase activator NlpD